MKASVFHSPRNIRVENVPDPRLQEPTDCILRVTSTAICGSDLHFYNGFIPQPKPMVMGHEFMGVVEEVGSEVHRLKRGDRVVVPFPIACGACFFCTRQLVGHCERSNPAHYGPDGDAAAQKGGALFGYGDLYGSNAGGQAEYVRVPYADVGPRRVPAGLSDEDVLFLSDILPTGYSAIEWAGLRGGETVAVFGAGPVGLMAMKSAWLRGASRVFAVDRLPYRLHKAAALTLAEPIDLEDGDPIEKIRAATDGRGVDVAVDAVGMEAHRSTLDKVKNVLHAQVGSIAGFELAVRAVRRGGFVSVVGVYAIPYDGFPWGRVFEKGITVRAGQAPAHVHIDHLLTLVESGRLIAKDIITHRLPLSEAARGYEMFSDKKEGCVKVVLTP